MLKAGILACAAFAFVTMAATPPTPAPSPAPTPSPSPAPLPDLPPLPTVVPAVPLPAPTPALHGEPRSIAVMPFDARLPSYIFGTPPASGESDCGTVSRPGADVSRRCTQELIEAIVDTQRFRVVDRDTLDRVLQEQNFQRTQGMDPKELARLGRLVGADRLVVTAVELAGTSCRRVEVRASGYLAFEFGGGIEVTYRVVDVATAEILAIGRVTNTWDSRPFPELRSTLSNPESALGFFARQSARAQISEVLEAIDPIRVAALQNDLVVLNQGRGRPMSLGMTLRVLGKVDPVRDPATGAVLSEEGPEVAIIQVIEAQERVSRARVLSGEITKVQVGGICRVVGVPAPGDGR